MKLHINWGRSCLEDRDAATPLQHITTARDKRVLAGVMFSGAGDKDTQYGWLPVGRRPPAGLSRRAEVMDDGRPDPRVRPRSA